MFNLNVQNVKMAVQLLPRDAHVKPETSDWFMQSPDTAAVLTAEWSAKKGQNYSGRTIIQSVRRK